VRAGGKQGVSDKEKRRKKKGESEKLINFAEMACAEEFPSMEGAGVGYYVIFLMNIFHVYEQH
jgi:hypothetical protein